MSYWVRAPAEREPLVLFGNRLDDAIGEDHPVRRDQHERRREAMRRRLATEEGKAAYRRRAPEVEGTFGVLKAAGSAARRATCEVPARKGESVTGGRARPGRVRLPPRGKRSARWRCNGG